MIVTLINSRAIPNSHNVFRKITIASVFSKFEHLQANRRTVRALSDLCGGGRGNDGVAKGKVALVTGSARGIGYCIAESLLQNGAKKVIISDVLEAELPKAANKLCSKYGEGRVCHTMCDVKNATSFEGLFDCIKQNFNQLDIVVNNAGILADSRWEDTLLINVHGVVRGTYLGFKYMGKHKGGKGGTIINLASILGINSFEGSPVYCGTKHFVVGFTRSMGTDYYCKLSNVKVMAVGPGVTETHMVGENAGQMAAKDFGDVATLITKGLGSLPSQPCEAVGECVIKMLEADINGSIWISEECECYRVKEVHRSKLKDKSEDKCC